MAVSASAWRRSKGVNRLVRSSLAAGTCNAVSRPDLRLRPDSRPEVSVSRPDLRLRADNRPEALVRGVSRPGRKPDRGV